MEGRVSCKNCKRESTVTPSSQTIRCHGCQRIIFSVEENHVTITLPVGTPTRTPTRYSHQEQGKIIGGQKCLPPPFHKRHSRYNASNLSTFSSFEQSSSSVRASDTPQLRGKRALLCGVTYNKQKFKLGGTINDVNGMRDLLLKTFSFPSDSIRILIEEENHLPPTKKNIQESMQWLVRGCQAGDSLVFYFSGHGLRQPDFNNEEQDGFDETLCPVDFISEGMIIDNYINETIVRPLKQGVTLHAIIDACHSGTVLDLPLKYNPTEKRWVDNRPPSGCFKGTNGGRAICFSACQDHQLAADTNAFTGTHMAGAMTYTFIRAVRERPKITYKDLLASVHQEVEEANKVNCLNFHLLTKIFHRNFRQEPQLSSTEEFDISMEFKL